jgi:PBSX family phage portal protein
VVDKPKTVKVVKYAKPPPQMAVIASRALEAEDEFRPYYSSDALGAGMSLIEPPYNPAILQVLCSENNTLGPCIAAMRTNIDETGYVIEKEDGTTPGNDPQVAKLQGFFDEVFPGLSFKSLRTKVRLDLEQTGNGYIEVLRNAKGEVVFLRHIPSRTIRCMRLDAPIIVEKKIKRGDEEFSVPTMIRERRYAQMVGAIWIYFREFGSARMINCDTGWWESENDDEQSIPFNKRGTEVIHLVVNPHYYTPYGMPRWEGQIPSVVGSRKAEEFNLEFFETGGIPPALITIAGGAMAEKAQQMLEDQFNTKNRSKHRVVVMETESTGGGLDQTGSVKVDVHTFGSERQNDAMFEKYDAQCFDRVRRAFRLPPMFLGSIDKMNFSVAYTSFLIAENQVFRPERELFDDMVNRLLMPEIGGKGYIYRSKNLSVADIQTKLAAIQIAAATQHVDPRDVVAAVNEVADLDLNVSDQPIPPPMGAPGAVPNITDPGFAGGGNVQGGIKPKVGVTDGAFKPAQAGGMPGAGGGKFGGGSDPDQGAGGGTFGTQKSDMSVLALADEAMVALRKRDLGAISRVLKSTDAMPAHQQQQFKAAMALRSYFDPSVDPEGLSELAGCSLVGMMRSGEMN